jgi:type IV fimbrial biogenesis protein FimT
MHKLGKGGVRGLTLIELMITIALLVIVIAIGVPSFQSVIASTRLSSAANEVTGAVHLARSEAIRRNRSVVLCRSVTLAACASADVWDGWIVFTDTNGDGTVSAGEEIIKTGTITAPLVLRASAGISSRANAITFLPNGMARGADEQALLNANLSLCVPATQPAANVRDVLIAFGGRTNVRSRSTSGVCTATPADS